jgi:hypothetical protein
MRWRRLRPGGSSAGTKFPAQAPDISARAVPASRDHMKFTNANRLHRKSGVAARKSVRTKRSKRIPFIARSLSPTARCSWFHPGPAVAMERSTKGFTRGWKKFRATGSPNCKRATAWSRWQGRSSKLVMTVADGILLPDEFSPAPGVLITDAMRLRCHRRGEVRSTQEAHG